METSREIKFRVFCLSRSKQKKFLGYERLGKFGWEISNVLFKNETRFSRGTLRRFWLFGDKMIRQQFTGLKDKTGKEIYEGDIISVFSESYTNENFIGKIIFDEGAFLTKVSNSDIRGFSPEFDMKVIGNIFENPELLK